MKRSIQSEDVPSSYNYNTKEAYNTVALLIDLLRGGRGGGGGGESLSDIMKQACEAGHPCALYLRDHVSRLESPQQILEELRAIEEPNDWCYYLQGCFTADVHEAARLFQLSNNSYAHFMLGVYNYRYPTRSLPYFCLAAKAGLSQAYMSCVVVSRHISDPKSHFDFCYRACHAGVREAYRFLSECYNMGHGTQQDLYQAVYWGSFDNLPIVSMTLSAVYGEYCAGDTRRMYNFVKAVSETCSVWKESTMQVLGARVKGATICAKRATLCWMWMQKENRFFPRDIAIWIGHLIWEGRKNEFYNVAVLNLRRRNVFK